LGIIGPVFLNESVTSDRYIEILRDNFIPNLLGLQVDISSSWFMQDGARPHRTTDVFELLFEHFDERIIALDSSSKISVGINLPAYSPDMNPCDYFLWGYLKDRIYSKSPKTIDQLKKSHRKRNQFSRNRIVTESYC